MTQDDSHIVTASICGFGRFLREEGFTIGLSEVLDALRIAELGLMSHRAVFERALCSLFAIHRSEAARFGRLFEAYWSGQLRRRHAVHRSSLQVEGPQSVPVLLRSQQATESAEASNDAQGASTKERLVQVDFAHVHQDDQALLEALAHRLFLSMTRRLTRRRTAARHGTELDLRRTIRLSIARGGTPLDLAYTARKPQRPRITALLDVSGSMDRYSYLLLRFIHALGRRYASVNAFVFSTHLRSITRALRLVRRPEELADLASESNAWRGGTRIAACLENFLNVYGPRALSRHTLVLVLSDGLETGDPTRLGEQVRRIQQRARSLIWLNPLIGMEGYQPLTRGIKHIMPHIDKFLPAHNLDSLLQLEAHLRDA